MEHALSYDKATKIWIPHAQDIWILCDIITVDEVNGKAIVRSAEQEEIHIDLSVTQQYHPSHSDDLDNLCTMNNFHEAPLLYSLRRRSCQQKIYTSIGDVLISVNPYRNIPGLYDGGLNYFLGNQESKLDTNAHVLPPHVFQIANNALQFMLHNQALTNDTNQSIIISGESGAGKTEASKKVIQYLIDIDNYLHQQDISQSNDSISQQQNAKEMELLGIQINHRIWESTYVFESFGNAKTIRNDNSSRFGKFIKLQYGNNNRLLTAFAETFLLEKSRLTSISSGERNYHIFYQLLRGNHETVNREELSLTSIEDYKILLSDEISQQQQQQRKKTPIEMSSYPSYPDVEQDQTEFQHLCQALITLGCSTNDMKSIWLLISTILHLGNCYSTPSTVETPSHREERAVEIQSSSLSVDDIAVNLGVSVIFLKRALTVRVIKAMNRQSFTSKCLTEEEANYNLKALIKHLYGSLFQWLQRTINQSFHLSAGPSNGTEPETKEATSDISHYRYIGILDIFGFEIFQDNSFEQLCINFANELLQKLFNDTLFASEQEEYAAGGIEWQSLDYVDNQAIIDLISKKPHGLFHDLDAQCMLNRKTDDTALVATFTKHHLKKPPTIYDLPKFNKNERFIIRHFAGEVEYSCFGFMSKNNISLQEDVQEILKLSTSAFIRKIFQTGTDEVEEVEKEEEVKNYRYGEGNHLKRIDETPMTPDSSDLGLSPSLASETSEPPTPTHPLLKTRGIESRRFAGQVTVSSHFREQLQTLISTLQSTKTHYIKCIKPNNEKKNEAFNSKLIMEQLKCNGIMELVRIKRQGYPTHSEFYNFYQVFSIIGHKKNWKFYKECTVEELKYYTGEIAKICLPTAMYQIGHHKIFLRDGFEIYMREMKLKIIKAEIILIQSQMRQFLETKRFHKIQLQIVQLQTFYRCSYYSSLYKRKKYLLIKIQKFYRMIRLQRKYQQIIQKIIQIQSIIRKSQAKEKYKLMIMYIPKIQNKIRMYQAKQTRFRLIEVRRRNEASLKMQIRVRIMIAKRQSRELKLEKERLIAEELERARLQDIAENARLVEEQERARLLAEEVERQRIIAQDAENARIASEEAKRIRMEEEAARVLAEETEKARLAVEEAERIRIAVEEENTRVAAEKAEIIRVATTALRKQRVTESRLEIDFRISQLSRLRAAIIIQVFYRLKSNRIQKPTHVQVKNASKPTIRELVVESYCQQYLRNLKQKALS